MIDFFKIYIRNSTISPKQDGRIKSKGVFCENKNSLIYVYPGIKLKQTDSDVLIEGSCCRFIHGNNLDKYSDTNLSETFDVLSSQLGLDISKGELIGFDYGRTLSLKDVPLSYISLFKEISGSTKIKMSSESTTLSIPDEDDPEFSETYGKEWIFKSKNGSFVIYDELKLFPLKEIPKRLKLSNRLRMELRLFNVSAQKEVFNSQIKPLNLLEKKYLDSLESVFQDIYSHIKKYDKPLESESNNPFVLNFLSRG